MTDKPEFEPVPLNDDGSATLESGYEYLLKPYPVAEPELKPLCQTASEILNDSATFETLEVILYLDEYGALSQDPSGTLAGAYTRTDVSEAAIATLKARVDELETRLEISYVFQYDDALGELVKRETTADEKADGIDGIYCRDETIKGLEENIILKSDWINATINDMAGHDEELAKARNDALEWALNVVREVSPNMPPEGPETQEHAVVDDYLYSVFSGIRALKTPEGKNDE